MKKRYQQPSCFIVRIESQQFLTGSGYTVNSYKSGGEENLGDAPPSAGAKSNSVNWDDDWKE